MAFIVAYEGDSTASAAILTAMDAAGGLGAASFAPIMRANGADVLIIGDDGT